MTYRMTGVPALTQVKAEAPLLRRSYSEQGARIAGTALGRAAAVISRESFQLSNRCEALSTLQSPARPSDFGGPLPAVFRCRRQISTDELSNVET